MKSLVRLRYRGTGTRSSIRLQGPTISAELLNTSLWPPFSRCSLYPRLIDTVNNNNNKTHDHIQIYLHLGNFLKSSAESVPRYPESVHYHEDKTIVEFMVTHYLRRRENNADYSRKVQSILIVTRYAMVCVNCCLPSRVDPVRLTGR